MTREEAIKNLKFVRSALNDDSRIAQSYDMAISALSAEGEYIKKENVDTLVDELARAISDERCFMSRGRSTASIMQDILDLPTYSIPDSAEGEWIDNGNGSYTCSNCKTEWTTSQIEKMRFCPTCGADMKGEADGK